MKISRNCHGSEVNIDSGTTYYQLGVMYHRKSDLANAQKNYETALQIFTQIFKKADSSNKYISKCQRELETIKKSKAKEKGNLERESHR